MEILWHAMTSRVLLSWYGRCGMVFSGVAIGIDGSTRGSSNSSGTRRRGGYSGVAEHKKGRA